jgi:hypothetical protein
VFQPSAYFATVCSVFRSPEPPIRIGRSLLHRAGVVQGVLRVVVDAAGGRRAAGSIVRISSTASSNQSSRSPKPEPNSIPSAVCSVSNQAPPIPEPHAAAAHVVEVVIIFTTRAGLRNVFAPTIRPSVVRSVRPAQPASVRYPRRSALRIADDRIEVIPRPERVVAEPVDERARLLERLPIRCTAARRGRRASRLGRYR